MDAARECRFHGKQSAALVGGNFRAKLEIPQFGIIPGGSAPCSVKFWDRGQCFCLDWPRGDLLEDKLSAASKMLYVLF
jgi:hypothetical protein